MKQGDELCIVRDKEAPVLASNTLMVAALLTFGIELDTDCPYQETREIVNDHEERIVTWVLKSKSKDGQYKTRELIAAWHDPAWQLANPEHPFGYVKAALINHRNLINAIKKTVPVFLVRKGKRIALIPADATDEERAFWMGKLEQ